MSFDQGRSLKPIVVIGAARSGTKFLRDVLAASPGVRVVPYDVNYLWRSGNESWADDCLTPDLCSPRLAAGIRRSLVRASEARGPGPYEFLIEKTVSNCLRVPFVNSVLPDAQFVHLIRDGRDVVGSAMRMWTAVPEYRYLFAKLRTFPLRNFGYALKFVRNQLAGRLQSGRAQRTWGPRYRGIDGDAEQLDLLTVCARQWEACVNAALSGLVTVDSSRVLTVRYERLVTDVSVIADLAAGLHLRGVDDVLAEYRSVLRPDSIAASARLSADQRRRLDELLGATLRRLDYASDAPVSGCNVARG